MGGAVVLWAYLSRISLLTAPSDQGTGDQVPLEDIKLLLYFYVFFGNIIASDLLGH